MMGRVAMPDKTKLSDAAGVRWSARLDLLGEDSLLELARVYVDLAGARGKVEDSERHLAKNMDVGISDIGGGMLYNPKQPLTQVVRNQISGLLRLGIADEVENHDNTIFDAVSVEDRAAKIPRLTINNDELLLRVDFR